MVAGTIFKAPPLVCVTRISMVSPGASIVTPLQLRMVTVPLIALVVD